MNQRQIKELEKTIISDYSNITGMIVQRNGIKLYENYFNGYTADNAVHVYSVTKSIFSALIGIAIDQGHIKSVDQKILEFFPDYSVAAGEKTIQNITIKNLLTMTVPFKFENEPYEEFFASDNWLKTALDFLGGEGPIGEFRYSPIIGAHILSGILVNATCQSILDFADKNLFSPLGINIPKNVMLRDKEEHIAVMSDKNTRGWVVDPQGINTASWGLFLTPEDMTKIGLLYLNGGIWDGKQIVPPSWITLSTKEHIRWDDLAYGYLWWVIDDHAHIYAALGDGGNVIYINSSKNLIVTVAGLFMPDVKDTIELIMQYIEPMFEIC